MQISGLSRASGGERQRGKETTVALSLEKARMEAANEFKSRY
jgi:hypothetical protein